MYLILEYAGNESLNELVRKWIVIQLLEKEEAIVRKRSLRLLLLDMSWHRLPPQEQHYPSWFKGKDHHKPLSPKIYYWIKRETSKCATSDGVLKTWLRVKNGIRFVAPVNIWRQKWSRIYLTINPSMFGVWVSFSTSCYMGMLLSAAKMTMRFVKTFWSSSPFTSMLVSPQTYIFPTIF